MDKKKIYGIGIALLLVVSFATAITVRQQTLDTIFDGGTFGSRWDTTINGNDITVWLLAKDNEYVAFGNQVRNKFPDSTTQYMIQSGSQTQTNVAAAATELTGNYRMIADLTHKDEIRFGTSYNVNGSINTRLYVQYSIGGANWFNISRNDSVIYINGVAPQAKVTGWEQLPLGTQATDVMLRVVTVGGDGAADPQYRGVWIETR